MVSKIYRTTRDQWQWEKSVLVPGTLMSLVSSAAAVTVGGLNMAVYVVAWDRRVGSAASPFVELEATPSETSLKGDLLPRRLCSWETTHGDLGRHRERWHRIAVFCVLYRKSSRADHLCFVRFLFVPLLCSLFVHIHIRKLCKVLHFLRPTHMQQHGVTVGQLAPTDHADVMDVSRKNVDNATAETDSRKPGSVEPFGCTGDSKVSPKQTVDGNGDTKPVKPGPRGDDCVR